MLHSVDYIEMEKKEREKFITERTKQEARVNAWYQRISGLQSDVLTGIIPEGTITLRTLCPELYEDKPNKEIYLQQLAAANAMFDKCNAIGEDKNREAVECLLKFKEISSTPA